MPKYYPGNAVEVIGQDVTVPNLITAGNVDGRDVSVDGTKLDGIEATADITDAVNVGTSVHGVADKNPPIDADKVPLIDTAAANVLKTSTWTNIKAFLKTYFDTLYNLYIHPNHSGEVTSVADGAQTIINDAVTYAKMQNVSATDKVLGRVTAGAGDVEEIACTAAGRALLDDASAADQKTTLSLNNVENTAHSTDAHIMAIDGRDVSVDGTKLDTIATNADVTGSNAPQAHKASHQDTGGDEISIAGLLGESTELATHKANTTTAHGAVSAATASKFVVRDASARAKFAVPGAAGDALIKGTRVTTAELPAMTDEKIWKGTGASVEEIDVPVTATRQFFVPCFFGTGGALTQYQGAYVAYRLTDVGVDTAFLSFRIPDDLTALTHVKVILVPTTTGTIDWTVDTAFGAAGEASTIHTDTTTNDAEVTTTNEVTELDISAAFTGVDASDIAGVEFTLDARDTTAYVDIIGLDIKYT